jgi:hypothetical protein
MPSPQQILNLIIKPNAWRKSKLCYCYTSASRTTICELLWLSSNYPSLLARFWWKTWPGRFWWKVNLAGQVLLESLASHVLLEG